MELPACFKTLACLFIAAMLLCLGPQQSISLYGSYSYRIQLDEADTRRLCLGIGVGVSQYSIDGASFIPVDNNDPAVPTGTVNSFRPDARVGIYYYTPGFYAGLSMLDLLSGNLFNTDLVRNNYHYVTLRKTRHMYLTSGCLLTVSDNFKLKPSFMLKDDFHGPTNLDLTMFALVGNQLWVGASYRTAVKLWKKKNLQDNLEQTDVASAMVQFFANDKLHIGYSYDFTTSGISGQQTGSHEIFLGIVLTDTHSKERILCPRFF